MELRGLVLGIYTIFFIVAIFLLFPLVPMLFPTAQERALFYLSALSGGFCGLVVVHSVYVDGREIKRLKEFTGLTKRERDILESSETLGEYIQRRRESDKDSDASD